MYIVAATAISEGAHFDPAASVRIDQAAIQQ